MKIEFQLVEEADRVLENGLPLFQMYVTADQITREEFYNVRHVSDVIGTKAIRRRTVKRRRSSALNIQRKAIGGRSVQIRQRSA